MITVNLLHIREINALITCYLGGHNNDINNISFCILPFARGLLLRYQENCHSHFASPKGATGQVHTLSAFRL